VPIGEYSQAKHVTIRAASEVLVAAVGDKARFTAASVINPAKNARLFCQIPDNYRTANIRPDKPYIRYISSTG